MAEDRQTSQTSRVKVGCAGLPGGATREQVFGAVSLLEENSLNRDPAPGPRALRRWRREAPEGAGFALIAPTDVFAPGAAGEDAVARLVAAVEALGPEVVLFRPGLEHAPSETNRERLRELAHQDLPGGPHAVFVPTGLWSPEISLSVATDLEISVAIDPLAADVQDQARPLWAHELDRGVAYLRIERLASARRNLDDYELDALAELVSDLDRGWVVLAHPDRLRDGRRLRQRVEA